MRIKLLILTIFYLLFFGVSPAFAVAPTISNVPSTIYTDSEFSISVTMSGLSSNTIYRLRLALAVTGTSNYFGATFNGSTYYNGTPSPINYANFLSVTTDGSGAWSGTLQGKVESSDPNFSGVSGTYDLKVGRYTASGTSATWSDIFPTNVVVPTPSPSPSPSPSTSPSPSSSSSPSPSTTSTSTSTFTISNTPSQIDSSEEFGVSVNLSLSNKPNTTFYLKGAFKKQAKTNYFGLTKVNGSWIRNNKSYSDHVKITTDSQGSWSGNLEIQPDILDSGYEGAGEYIFKVGRYTDSGSLTWSNEVTIRINAQEIALEDSDSDILGISGTQNNKVTTKSPKKEKEEYSLEKYIKIATPVAKATASGNQQAAVKGESRTNYLNWVGLFMTVCGTSIFAYVYLRNKDLRETIFNLFRKRN